MKKLSSLLIIIILTIELLNPGLTANAATSSTTLYNNAYNATINVVKKANKYSVKPYYKKVTGATLSSGKSTTTAVVNAVNNGLQKDINTSRAKINLLISKSLASKKSILSSIVDNYQQSITERVIALITADKVNPYQVDINNLKVLLKDYPEPNRTTYLKLVDGFQKVINDRQKTSTTPTTTTTKPSVPSIPPSSVAGEDEEFAYNVAKEIADPKYKGRITGTDGYTNAAKYVSSVFRQVGLETAGDNGTYLQAYNTDVAEFNTTPTLTINGKSLELFKDFRIVGYTDSGTINGNSIIFAGYGYEEDFANLNVSGKIVAFMADIKNGQAKGVMDRVMIAKGKGASAVLLLPNKYLPISSSEKPLTSSNVGLPCLYVSKEVFSSMGLDENTPLGTENNVNINGSVSVNRASGKIGYNVIGKITGIDTSKTIVISASLDSYGLVPNGMVMNGASTSASGVGIISSLAKYYATNKPAYNILVVAFGGQITGMEGSKFFVNSYKGIGSVIADIDLYDIGSADTFQDIFYSVGAQYTDLHAAIVPESKSIIDTGSEVNYPFGNNYPFSTKGIANVFVRYCETHNSLTDNISNVSKATLKTAIRHIKNIITALTKDANRTESTTAFDPSKVRKEYVNSINETLNVYETKYTSIYYEDLYPISSISDLVSHADEIYTEDLWWNYTAVNDVASLGKIKIYCVDGWDEGWEVTNRMDKKGTGEKSGGYQSFTDYSISIVRNSENTYNGAYDLQGTFAHEFNHVLANRKTMSYPSVIDNQEISGHVYPFTIGNTDGKRYFKATVQELSTPNGLASVDWSQYTADGNMNLTNPQQWNEHYDLLASVEYFIWEKYGKDICREIQYEFYKNPRPAVKDVFEKKLGKDFNTILTECYQFYNS